MEKAAPQEGTLQLSTRALLEERQSPSTDCSGEIPESSLGYNERSGDQEEGQTLLRAAHSLYLESTGQLSSPPQRQYPRVLLDTEGPLFPHLGQALSIPVPAHSPDIACEGPMTLSQASPKTHELLCPQTS